MLFKRQTRLQTVFSLTYHTGSDITQAVFAFRLTVSWYMCRCIFTNASKESRGFPVPFFMKFTSAMRADLVTEFHPNSTVNVGSKDGISFTPRSKVRVSLH